MSFKPQVMVAGAWAGNGLAFATQAEAALSARHLSQRWMLAQDYRAVESTDPVNYIYSIDGVLEAVQA